MRLIMWSDERVMSEMGVSLRSCFMGTMIDDTDDDLTGEEGDGQGALVTTLERNVVTDEWDEDEDGGEDE
jgi:hypothetical protein